MQGGLKSVRGEVHLRRNAAKDGQKKGADKKKKNASLASVCLPARTFAGGGRWAPKGRRAPYCYVGDDDTEDSTTENSKERWEIWPFKASDCLRWDFSGLRSEVTDKSRAQYA